MDTTLLDLISQKVATNDSPYKFETIPVPRVTEILQFIDMEPLIGWANYIGMKHMRYQDVINEATTVGSITHGNIEKFLQNKPVNEYEAPIAYKSFLKWWEYITQENMINILGQEETLICKYFGGTYDMLMSFNDKKILVDFKTSTHIGYKYFMQLAAYRYMLYMSKGIVLDGCLILQLNKKEIGYSEYWLDFSDPIEYNFIEACTNSFFSLVNLYYNIYETKRMFSDIFNKK